MKYLLLFSCACLSVMQVQAQSISKQVIGSSGSELSNSNYSINFTVGEAIVGNINNGATLHQGFWAELNSDGTLSIETLVEDTESISVFPNPVVNLVQIKFNLQEAINYKTQLYDVSGKQIFQINPKSQGQITQINISHLSSGMYLLVISDTKTNYNKTFKILKH